MINIRFSPILLEWITSLGHAKNNALSLQWKAIKQRSRGEQGKKEQLPKKEETLRSRFSYD